MNRPDDIPQDAWNDAIAALETLAITKTPKLEIIARALLAEREACVERAGKWFDDFIKGDVKEGNLDDFLNAIRGASK